MSYASKGFALGRNLRPRGPVQLKLTEDHNSTATVLKVDGELDILTAPKLSTQVDEVVRRDAGDVVIDLRRTEFMDSAGLHILLGAQLRLTRKSRRLFVVCPPGPVRRAIELARLIETLGVMSSMREYRRHAAASPRGPAAAA